MNPQSDVVRKNGVRGGSATVHFPIWHQEIEDILVLKNNKGTEDNRVRKLDYSIQLSKYFMNDLSMMKISVSFLPHDVPDLYDAFGESEFDELYEKYRETYSIPKKKIMQEHCLWTYSKKEARNRKNLHSKH